MSGNMEYRGLCSTCRNAPTCTFPRDPSKPTFYCEQFETDKPPPIKTTLKEELPSRELRAGEEKDLTKFIGLCSNCDNRRACTFPRPEGGIWHCEEYQ
jgi:hypothetical protein